MPRLPKPSDHQANGDDTRVPAVIYAAKSTDDPRGSIETQITDCEAMAASESWGVVGTYFDEAASAYHGNRGDGLTQAREHVARLAAEHGKAVLVVQHSDRLSRGDGVCAAHLVEYVLWAMNTGVVIRSVQDDRGVEGELEMAGEVVGRGQWMLSVKAPELSGRPDTPRPSRLPHNTRPGSSQGTAGDSPRRSRRVPHAISRW